MSGLDAEHKIQVGSIVSVWLQRYNTEYHDWYTAKVEDIQKKKKFFVNLGEENDFTLSHCDNNGTPSDWPYLLAQRHMPMAAFLVKKCICASLREANFDGPANYLREKLLNPEITGRLNKNTAKTFYCLLLFYSYSFLTSIPPSATQQRRTGLVAAQCSRTAGEGIGGGTGKATDCQRGRCAEDESEGSFFATGGLKRNAASMVALTVAPNVSRHGRSRSGGGRQCCGRGESGKQQHRFDVTGAEVRRRWRRQ